MRIVQLINLQKKSRFEQGSTYFPFYLQKDHEKAGKQL